MASPAMAAAPTPVPTARIAVILPCFNEAAAIGKVVADFRAALPAATVYVYDNNSTDATADLARAAGAVVRHEGLQGKGNVLRRAFSDVDADIYVLADGDDTYDATTAPEMVRLLVDGRLDMITGVRKESAAAAYRRGHRFGNRVLTGLVGSVFDAEIADMLSGYRVFSRRFVKSFPALASGFETETEFTVHALELRMATGEVSAAYRERPMGSTSKLHTYRDGLRILRTIVVLVKEERPLSFFSLIAAWLLLGALALGLPVVSEFWRTGLVPRLPTALLAASLVLLASLSATCGLVLESVTRGRRELKRLAYLAIPVLPDSRD
jgi:glycosyltransferase involved in cell wall biosynthesis